MPDHPTGKCRIRQLEELYSLQYERVRELQNGGFYEEARAAHEVLWHLLDLLHAAREHPRNRKARQAERRDTDKGQQDQVLRLQDTSHPSRTDVRLQKLQRLLSLLLDSPSKWRGFGTAGSERQHTLSSMVRFVQATELEPALLQAVFEVTGRCYRRLESFDADLAVDYHTMYQVLTAAAKIMVTGKLDPKHKRIRWCAHRSLVRLPCRSNFEGRLCRTLMGNI